MKIDLGVIDLKKIRIVVFDVAGSQAHENDLFDRALVRDRHAWAACYLYEECLRHNIQLLTADLFFKLPKRPDRFFLIRNSTIPSAEKELLKLGAHPAILLGFEHPLYSCLFYWNLGRETKGYDHVFMPEGARPWVSKRAQFHSWISPQPYWQNPEIVPNFRERKFLAMITGNTSINPLKRFFVHVANTIRRLPSLVDRELYIDRLDAVKYFSQFFDFDFYGRGWSNPIPYGKGSYDASIKMAWRGEAGDKIETLSQYKFSIVFENCIFDGWVTEKIVDSMAAGCVPIYWGAPDITKYVPANTFIDYRNFKSFAELNEFLRAMDETTYANYIKNINAYFRSPQYFEHFSQEKFADDIVAIINSYAI